MKPADQSRLERIINKNPNEIWDKICSYVSNLAVKGKLPKSWQVFFDKARWKL